MSITLEERLQRAAELLDQAAAQPSALDTNVRPLRRDHRGGSPVWARVAAVLLVLGAMVGVAWLSARDTSDESSSSSTTGAPSATATTADGSTDTTSAASETTAAGSVVVETTAAALEVSPAATLPSSPDLTATPITVQGSGPTQWYRLRPDLDVAWYSDGGNESQLCFRTPVLEQCQPDRIAPGSFVVVQSAGGQWLVVTVDAVDVVTVRFDDGTQRAVPVAPDPQLGWRTGRIDAGTPIDATMTFDGTDVSASDSTAVPASLATSP